MNRRLGPSSAWAENARRRLVREGENPFLLLELLVLEHLFDDLSGRRLRDSQPVHEVLHDFIPLGGMLVLHEQKEPDFTLKVLVVAHVPSGAAVSRIEELHRACVLRCDPLIRGRRFFHTRS